MDNKEAKTYFNDFPPVGVNSSGDPVYQVRVMDPKTGELKVTGQRDLQKEVNAAAVGVTPYELIDKYELTGDDSVINRNPPSAGDVDVSGLPETMSEANAVIDNAVAALQALKKEPPKAAASAAAVSSDTFVDPTKKDGK